MNMRTDELIEAAAPPEVEVRSLTLLERLFPNNSTLGAVIAATQSPTVRGDEFGKDLDHYVGLQILQECIRNPGFYELKDGPSEQAVKDMLPCLRIMENVEGAIPVLGKLVESQYKLTVKELSNLAGVRRKGDVHIVIGNLLNAGLVEEYANIIESQDPAQPTPPTLTEAYAISADGLGGKFRAAVKTLSNHLPKQTAEAPAV